MNDEQATAIYERFNDADACAHEIRKLEKDCSGCGKFSGECDYCPQGTTISILCIRYMKLIKEKESNHG